MIDILEICKNSRCSGCGACKNICKQNAISMINNPQGFAYPCVDESKCTNCGLCSKVCPIINPPQANASVELCYAVMASDDVRKESSSGGVFSELSKKMLKLGGVVCGVTMDENYEVFHKIITREDELNLLRKSKYVQSNTGNVYVELKRFLSEGRRVLFSGCPCQIAAARNFFSEYRDKVIYVDIVCHGVPSNQMWQDYLHENFDLSKVNSIYFRNKYNGWRADQLLVDWKDGSKQIIPWAESAYEEGFQRNITLRDVCSNCDFSGLKRQGDITIGDFWQCEKHNPDLSDGKGTSLVFINNDIGEEYISDIKQSFQLFTSAPISAANNNRLSEEFPKHPMADRFKTLYPGHRYTDAVMQCRYSLYDIGLVGLYCVKNFGGQLTQYALYYTLMKMGYSVLMIECPNNSRNPASPRGPYLFKECPYPSYAMSKHYNTIAEMKFLNKQCKTFITGSDQMFNNNSWNNHGKFMSLNFVNDNHRKIAYAASWGHDRIWGEEGDRGEESYFLQKFDYFSVREKSAIELAKREFGINAVHVLDPVFLVDKEEYDRMSFLFENEVPKTKYLFTYMLDPDKEKEASLKECANTLDLSIRAILDEDPDNKYKNISEYWGIETINQTHIENLVAHIDHSSFVITDSFHGMCLCIILHKDFLVMVNKRRGETRFKSVVEQLGLADRLCYSFDEIKNKIHALKSINYSFVDRNLEAYKEYSLHWLKNAIEAPMAKKSYSGYDVIDNRVDILWRHADTRCDDLNRKYESLLSRVNAMEELLNKNR